MIGQRQIAPAASQLSETARREPLFGPVPPIAKGGELAVKDPPDCVREGPRLSGEGCRISCNAARGGTGSGHRAAPAHHRQRHSRSPPGKDGEHASGYRGSTCIASRRPRGAPSLGHALDTDRRRSISTHTRQDQRRTTCVRVGPPNAGPSEPALMETLDLGLQGLLPSQPRPVLRNSHTNPRPATARFAGPARLTPLASHGRKSHVQ